MEMWIAVPSTAACSKDARTCTCIVTSWTMFFATFSLRRVSYLTSRGTPVASANALPSVFEVTSTCSHQEHRVIMSTGCAPALQDSFVTVTMPGSPASDAHHAWLQGMPGMSPTVRLSTHPGPYVLYESRVQGRSPHLHAHKLGHLAVLCLDGRHGEKVPEGRPIPFVVEQAHRAALPLLDCIPDDSHLLRICPFPLQEAAARKNCCLR